MKMIEMTIGAEQGLSLPNLNGMILMLDPCAPLFIRDADGLFVPSLGYTRLGRWIIHPQRFDELRFNLLPPLRCNRDDMMRWADDGGRA